MTEPPSFNMVDAEQHYNKWPHPQGILVMQLATGAHQEDHPLPYDAVWPALRSDIKRAWGHKHIDDLERFLYNLYRFRQGEERPHRWMFWRYPEPPKPRKRSGEPPKQLFWFDDQFEWRDFVEYGDGVACDSEEGAARGRRNFSRLYKILSPIITGHPEQVMGEWDWLRGELISNAEVPF